MCIKRRTTLVPLQAMCTLDIEMFLDAKVDPPDMALEALVVCRRKVAVITAIDLAGQTLMDHPCVEAKTLRCYETLVTAITLVWSDAGVCSIVDLETLTIARPVRTDVTAINFRRLAFVYPPVLLQISQLDVLLVTYGTLKLPKNIITN